MAPRNSALHYPPFLDRAHLKEHRCRSYCRNRAMGGRCSSYHTRLPLPRIDRQPLDLRPHPPAWTSRQNTEEKKHTHTHFLRTRTAAHKVCKKRKIKTAKNSKKRENTKLKCRLKKSSVENTKYNTTKNDTNSKRLKAHEIKEIKNKQYAGINVRGSSRHKSPPPPLLQRYLNESERP